MAVVAIVSAYNEAPTVGDVVRVLKSSTYLQEVIVVSDGSSDQTAQVARDAGATVYELPENRGKGTAMLYGVHHTDAEIILFVDADLLGFKTEHVEQLVLPVLSGSRVMNVGLRDRGIFFSRFQSILPLISGERAMKRQVIEGIPPEFLQRFMVETAINYFCQSRHLPFGAVFLKGLTIRRKYEKVGWKQGMVQYIRMASQILTAMLTVRIARLFNRF